MKWVKLTKYCALSGDTPDAVYAKNRKRIWIEGIHYRKVEDGCIWINIEEVEKWVAQVPVQPQQRHVA
ncbi:excisionase family protein [Bordetella avium]|uniref:Phage excisionase n=1 Tax=Bordetella avium (strain 197N) TaxID=360910 RepID=Q2L301_BORA1|nr:excisionase family protein [Bordetella avium]CAJ48888.1 phage excisionase [Bordetella avium 197N]